MQCRDFFPNTRRYSAHDDTVNLYMLQKVVCITRLYLATEANYLEILYFQTAVLLSLCPFRVDPAIPQAIRCLLDAAKPWVQSRLTSCNIPRGRSGTEAGSSPRFFISPYTSSI
jgi:hypothetical protein